MCIIFGMGESENKRLAVGVNSHKVSSYRKFQGVKVSRYLGWQCLRGRNRFAFSAAGLGACFLASPR